MSRVFGVAASGITATGVMIQSCSRKESIEWSEPQDGEGKVTDKKALSKTVSVSISGIVDGSVSLQAGTSITVGSDTLAIDSIDQGWSKDASTFSLEASKKDNATVTAYSASSSGSGTQQ